MLCRLELVVRPPATAIYARAKPDWFLALLLAKEKQIKNLHSCFLRCLLTLASYVRTLRHRSGTARIFSDVGQRRFRAIENSRTAK